MVAGISLNGKIADEKGDFSKYSSAEDKKWLSAKIAESDVVVMGRTTYEKHLKDQPKKKPLIVFTRSISGLRIDESSSEIHFFHDSKEELLNLCNLLQYNTVTILGGSEVYHWFIEQKLVTDLYLTVEPLVFGKGVNFLSGNFLSDQKAWKLKSSEQLNNKGSLLLHYQPL
jgi:dihydrofolate reductase